MPFAVRRAAPSAAGLAAIAAVAAVLAGGLAASTALAASTVDDGAATLVAAADPADRSIVVDAPPDAAAAVTAAVDRAFTGAPVHVARTMQATAVGSLGPTLLWDAPGIAARARLVDGTWPSGAGEVAVGEPAAAHAGLHAGSMLTLDGRPVQVSGIWQATDATDPAWADRPAVFSGRDADAVGPVLADASLVEQAGGARATWTISAARPVTTARIAAYRDGIDRLTASVDAMTGQGIRVTGRWEATLNRAASAAALARGLLGVPAALLAVIGALTLGVLAHSAGRRRADQVRLLRARGAATGSIVRESTGLAAGAVAAGVVAAAAVLAATGVLPLASAAGAASVIGVMAVVGIVAALLVATVLAVASLAAPPARGDVGRRSLAGVAAALALAALLTAIAAAQLLSAGLVRDGSTDAAAAAAPALALVAAALVVTLLAAPVFSLAERAVRPGRGLPVVLAVRRLARQAAVVVAGVLSVALAAAAIAFAVSATTRVGQVVHADVARLVGTDVRAVYDSSPVVDPTHPSMSAGMLPAGAGSTTAAFAADATLGRTPVRLVALPGTRLGVSAADAPVAHGPVSVTVTAAMADGGAWPDGTLAVRVWLLDRDGAARELDVGDVPVDGRAHALAVPTADGDPADGDAADGDRVAAIEVAAASAPGAISVRVTVAGAAVDPASVTLDPAIGRVRALTAVGADQPLPVLVTRALADRLALQPGSPVALRVGTIARPVEGRVVAVRDGLPGVGAGAGVAVDLGGLTVRALALGGSVPAAGELWVDTADVPAASAALRGIADRPVRVLTAAAVGSTAVIDPVLGLSAAGTAVAAGLAAVAAAAVAIAAVRTRRAESVPLRAFGFSRSRQRATGAIEMGAAACFAAIGGAAAGIGVAAWLAPALLAAVTVGGVS
ncbi:hypothetical protein [Microbacterium luticocti]|uniref:hypothetical protein n=1 Tax=Microbacterium luticocti TaxID=451764 RepID=UPI00040E31CD|nr:hypothetical protein [Microbacterium luticocti]